MLNGDISTEMEYQKKATKKPIEYKRSSTTNDDKYFLFVYHCSLVWQTLNEAHRNRMQTNQEKKQHRAS